MNQSIRLDQNTHNLIREGVTSEMNPFDYYAVEEAIRIKERLQGKVTAVTMGLPSASKCLRRTLAMGCDQGRLLTDQGFAGADTLATAYALSMAIKQIDHIDLIICGRQAVDGDTAQVGPSLAEHLGIPHVTCVQRISEINSNYIICERMSEGGYDEVQVFLPALITVVKGINTPRIPSIRNILEANSKEVLHLSIKDLHADKTRCGRKGSPTQVKKAFKVHYTKDTEMIVGDRDHVATEIIKLLKTTGGDIKNVNT